MSLIHIYAEQQLSDISWRLLQAKSVPRTNSMYWVLFESLAANINTLTGRRGMPNDACDWIQNKRTEQSGTSMSYTYSYMSIAELQRIAAELLLEIDSEEMYARRTDVSSLLAMFTVLAPRVNTKHERAPLFVDTGNPFRRLVYYFI